MKAFALLFITPLVFLIGCDQRKLTENKAQLPSQHYHFVNQLPKLAHEETIYVPIYSDIYIINGGRRQSLTATFSIRNTSLQDTMYVKNVDYYDSQGKLVSKYLDKPIYLSALQSVEFIVEYTEQKGGAGANFIVDWGAKTEYLTPIFQAVMVGSDAQHGITFLTEGIVINRK